MDRRFATTLATLATIALVLGACSAASTEASPTPHPTLAPRSFMPAPSTAAPVVGEVPDAILAAVRADLAVRLGHAPADVTVVRGEQVEWTDSALGCPKPGLAYLPVVTPGYRVVVQADGHSYDYRASERGVLVRCDPSLGSLPLP